jgi:hypothetical protein
MTSPPRKGNKCSDQVPTGIIEFCGYGIFIPDPDFYLSRIPHLGPRIKQQQQKRGKKFVVLLFTVAPNFTQLKIISFLSRFRKNVEPIHNEYITFYPKYGH